MQTLLSILISTLIISLISFIGIFTLFSKKRTIHAFMGTFVSFAAGAILAAVFFDLIPQAFGALGTFMFVLVGIVFFFIFEAVIHWHHHHQEEECHDHDKVKPVVLLNLTGDAIHNFLDGLLIAASFMINTATGITATMAIALHEIPQEIGDYAILLHGGLSKKKALGLNFLTGLTAVLGGIIGFFFLTKITGLIPYIVSIAAGGLLYIALADVLP